ncbi:phosphate ABC transporter substrate-binding protein PstS [Chachezhania sediminis]|uniref:phosphate ABC transporter substrate-binding protein PstS n=1 Tax=Chachezhania sediminis TaxID=2599291 RepID=UPI00131EB96E|nr:phosphate ABC transporter substrate-binding protein PstS [Chachezhania sediminis]
MFHSHTLKAAVVAAVVATPVAADVSLTGSGASFPFPLYTAWFKDMAGSTGVKVNYQSKGSGAGISDLINGVVDFAASDAAMSDEEIAQVKGGVILAPMTAGEIVIAYNLDGADELKLPRDVYADIFLTKIDKWNDPRIAAANPGVDLPDEDITVVVRSDSSGTTYNFSGHMAAISPEFAEKVGHGKQVEWPTASNLVQAPKNDGVTATIKQTPGAIGYIEYGYAKLTKTPAALLENKAGNFVAPGAEGGAAALAQADFDSHMRSFNYDPEGEQTYPITTFTWLLFYASGQDAEKVAALKEMVNYGLTTGQTMSDAMGYVPLPEVVVQKVRAEMDKIQ